MSEPRTYEAYPQVYELLSNGGWPGVQYLLVPSSHLHKAEKAGWELTNGIKSFSLTAGEARVDGVLLMSRGKPTPGASQHNGTRRLFISAALDKALGIKGDTDYVDPLTMTAPEGTTATATVGA